MPGSVSYTVPVGSGVALLTLVNPPVNSLSNQLRTGMHAGIQRALADDSIKAIVITGDGKTFPAGADISEFSNPKLVRINPLPSVIDEIEASTKPVIAAIHGTALGGGLEVALGCHYRIASEGSRLGLPEVQLGILPGAGGTQRLPRVIGTMEAIKMITTGMPVKAAKALKMMLLDEVVPKQVDLVGYAIKYARMMSHESLDNRRISSLVVPQFMSAMPFMIKMARKMVGKQARGMEAPQRCIDACEAAQDLPFKEGMKLEQKLIFKLMASKQSAALRHLFFAQRQAQKIPGLQGGLKPSAIKSVAIIGAGTMGAGIAMCFVQKGIPVLLFDIKEELATKGKKIMEKNWASGVKKGRTPKKLAEKWASMVTTTASYDHAMFGKVDLVIEAVFESMKIKGMVFTELERVTHKNCILASNTSSLDLDKIAAFTKRPDKVIGMHFFSPANLMMLLENVRGAKTSDQTIVTVMAISKFINKVAVLVGNCDGFVGNRIIFPYGEEAANLVEEGATPAQVDEALFNFGMPMGPLAMGDMAGNDVGYKIRTAKGLVDPATRPKDMRYNTLPDKLVLEGRVGLKKGAGWYNYAKGSRKPKPSPEVAAMMAEHAKTSGVPQRKITEEEIVERCVYAMVNEAFKVMEDGMALRPSDVDIVYIFGYGFPRHKGGVLHYADQVGLKKIAAKVVQYGAASPGTKHWKISPLLKQLAAQNTTLAKYWKAKEKASSKL